MVVKESCTCDVQEEGRRKGGGFEEEGGRYKISMLTTRRTNEVRAEEGGRADGGGVG